jgi:hypothetical protein
MFIASLHETLVICEHSLWDTFSIFIGEYLGKRFLIILHEIICWALIRIIILVNMSCGVECHHVLEVGSWGLLKLVHVIIDLLRGFDIIWESVWILYILKIILNVFESFRMFLNVFNFFRIWRSFRSELSWRSLPIRDILFNLVSESSLFIDFFNEDFENSFSKALEFMTLSGSFVFGKWAPSIVKMF